MSALRKLNQVVGLRRVQQQAAEMEAMQAAASVKRQTEAQDEAQLALDDSEAGWAGCFAPGGRGLSLDMARAWSSMILENEAQLHVAQKHLQDAEAEKALKAQAWGGARARTDGAKKAARTAARRSGNRREEAQLAESSELLWGRSFYED